MQLLYAQFISYAVDWEANARVSVFMGAGCGKSRLASVIAWHLLLGKRASYVTFVYPTAYLKKREQVKFGPLFQLLVLTAQVNWLTLDELKA